MKPLIDKSAFGWIQIAGRKFKHDIVIEHDGTIRKRKKKLSKAEYGTSHKISLAEAQDVYTRGVNTLLVGSGMFDSVRLSDEAANFFVERDTNVIILPTGKAIQYWNENQQVSVGLFHITC